MCVPTVVKYRIQLECLTLKLYFDVFWPQLPNYSNYCRKWKLVNLQNQFSDVPHDGILGGLLCMYNLLPAESQTPPESPVNWLWPKPINKDRGVCLGLWIICQCKTSVNAIRNVIDTLLFAYLFCPVRRDGLKWVERETTHYDKSYRKSSCHT